MPSNTSTGSVNRNISHCYLTQEEIDDPTLVFKAIFDDYHIAELREDLWEFIKIMVIGDFPRHLQRLERWRILLLFEYFQKLVEAGHIINERNKISISTKEE